MNFSIPCVLVLSLLLVSCGTSATESHPRSKSMKALVLDQPLLQPILYNGEERYQSIRDWSFRLGNAVHVIPLGTVVDGASVPRSAWSYMPPDGLHRAGAYAHDWVYAHRGIMPNGDVVTRSEADTLFYNLMVRGGVEEKLAGTAYRAVRLAGWKPWMDSSGQPIILPLQPTVAAKRSSSTRHLYADPN